MATALYRRYRPESFADVIGQEHVTEPLMQALRTARVGHAYLFSGPRGCGKTTSARILARCLNCEQGPTPTPCGTCDSCVALARGGPGSVDVIEIDAASHGGVDDARDLRERASYGPAQSRYKIYIIDEAHMVTPQGFNALLKIVEEPPEHVKFVFATTEPEKVIGTIRSRTHHYPFRLVPPAKLISYMERLLEQEGVAVEPGVLSFVSRAGGGSVRDSLSVLDQLIAGSGPEGLTYDGAVSLLGFTDAELLDATIDALAAGDGAATFRQVDRVIESGHDPRRFVEDLLERLRDLIIVAAVQEGAGQVLRGVPEDQLERMRVQQAAFGPGALSRAADIVNTGLTEMTGATSPRLQLELICARILLPAASGEQGYAARLDRIERRLEVGGVPSGSSTQPLPPSTERHAPPTPSVAPSTERHAPAPAPVPSSSDRSAPSAPAAPPVSPSSDRSAAPAPATPSISPSSDRSAPVGAPVSPSSDRPAPAAPSAAGQSSQGGPGRAGGLDTDAIRRAWPDVLNRVFQMRRGTWTLVSQNAQVIGYDGRVLTLGIATGGIANTFRQGNHAEILRQALIDALGIDAKVDGVHAPDAWEPGHGQEPSAPAFGGSQPEGAAPAAPPPPEPAPPEAAPQPAAPEQAPAQAATVSQYPAPSLRAAPPAPPGNAGAIADAGLAPAPPRRSLEDNAGWGSVTTAPPDWATGPVAPTAGRQQDPEPEPSEASTTGVPPEPENRQQAAPRSTRSGADAVRASLDAARRAGAPTRPSKDEARKPFTDDSAVSDDDEDIEVSTDVGRAVIEKVLGGRVLHEFDE
ncbi:MAG TPA: DNA polymerase III subunit gamma and tau [Intrasporangium sp.]|nr:DNA polymerase III subunit gamma and tau [Intrasporangium sp.]